MSVLPRARRRLYGPPADALLLLCVAALAAVPRVVGLRFGLPNDLHPDEPALLAPACALLEGAPWADAPWKHPPLPTMLAAGWLVLARGAGLLTGRCMSPAGLEALRWLSCGVGVAAVLGTALAARRLSADRRVWCTAGMLAASFPLLVQYGRYVKPDVFAAAGAALASIGWAGSWRDPGRPREAVLAGLGVATAAACKYDAALLGLGVAGIVVSTSRAAWRVAVASAFTAGVVALSSFAALVLVAGAGVTPMISGISHEWGHYGRGHGGYDTAHPVLDALRWLVLAGPGIPALLALLVGAALGGARRGALRSSLVGGGAILLGYAALVGAQQVFFDRLWIPLIPWLCVAIALAVGELVARWPARRRFAIAAIGVVLAGSAAPTALQCIRVARPDTRARVFDELLNRFPRGMRLAVYPGRGHQIPPLGRVFELTAFPDGDLRRIKASGHRWLLVSDGTLHRYTRSPERFPGQVAADAAVRAALAAHARLDQRWESSRLPSSDVFGSTADAFHQPTLELWDLGE